MGSGIRPGGPEPLDTLRNPLFGAAACSAVLPTLVTAPSTDLLEHDNARVMARSLSVGDTLTTALAVEHALATVFPAGSSLAAPLKMVARMIRRQRNRRAKGGGPDDVGQWRLLPSTSVDQFAATLGRWFGISDTDLLGVLPNLGRCGGGMRGVGFV